MPAADDDPRADQPNFAGLARRALEGDQRAKDELVDKLGPLVWHVIADFGLSKEDRQDVYAGAFCRLFEHLSTIRDPDRLPGWIATTARNEARSLLRARGRMVLSDDVGEGEQDTDPPTDAGLLDTELRVALHRAFLGLPRKCQQLLRLVTSIPRLSYEEVGDLLGMPHGSIGPTRQRCLDRLRKMPPFRPFLEGGQP